MTDSKYPSLQVIGALFVAALIMGGFLYGCDTARMPMLNPVGDVTGQIYELLSLSTMVMLAIIVPTMLGTIWVVWRFREGSGNKDFDPDFDHSPVIDKITFYVPLVTIVVLGSITWVYTHRLDPYRAREAAPGTTRTPFEIQAVSLDYKWLFIYPQAGIATVNEMVAPTNRSVTIRITSDPMMTAIFIPSLVSQIYAMTGMETRANFMSPRSVVVEGANAMYSGPEFYKQRFKVRIVSEAEFDSWQTAVAGGQPAAAGANAEPKLDFARYLKLAERTAGYPITSFSTVEPDLFQKVVRQYSPEYRVNPLPEAPSRTSSRSGMQPAQHKGH